MASLSGQTFGRLKVLDDFYKKPKNPKGNRIYWHCKCECGNEKYIEEYHLISGKTKSCGCLRKEITKITHEKHNKSNSRLYNVWNTIKTRCCCPTNKNYPDYGGRGIEICKEWLDYQNFYCWAIENGYDENAPRGTYTIERNDVNKGYEPNNCKWINQTSQSYNRRNSIKFVINGIEKALGEWCKIYNVPYYRTLNRIKKGWSIEDALTKPKYFKEV